MVSCEKCGKDSEELYEVDGQKVCEDCAIVLRGLKSPAKQCGPEK